MGINYADFAKKRAARAGQLAVESKKLTTKQSYTDDRFWQPSIDKSGSGYAVIRFLPGSDKDNVDWVQYYDHAFKGPTGRWYFEKSLTTFKELDPVSESNGELWNTGIESNMELARERKRRNHFVSNILVINDPKVPDNNGKVFLFNYGIKIFKKIDAKLNPDPAFPDEEAIDIFDFENGCNFKLKIAQVEGYRNYDMSSFDAPSPVKNPEKIFNQLYHISDLISPDKFKSYDELKTKLNQVLGVKTTENSAAMDVAKSVNAKERPSLDKDETDDDTLSYFERMAMED